MDLIELAFLQAVGGGGGGGGGIVDTEMSDSSTNAVQNKVIKSYVDNKIDEFAITPLSDELVNLYELDAGAYVLSNDCELKVRRTDAMARYKQAYAGDIVKVLISGSTHQYLHISRDGIYQYVGAKVSKYLLDTDIPNMGVIEEDNTNLYELEPGLYLCRNTSMSVIGSDEEIICTVQDGSLISISTDQWGGKAYFIEHSDFGHAVLVIDDGETVTVKEYLDLESAEFLFQPKSKVFSNITVATSDWISDNTYSGYGYKAVIPCQGVEATDIADVYFSSASAALGTLAPFCDEGTNSVTIYCSANNVVVTIKRIEVR